MCVQVCVRNCRVWQDENGDRQGKAGWYVRMGTTNGYDILASETDGVTAAIIEESLFRWWYLILEYIVNGGYNAFYGVCIKSASLFHSYSIVCAGMLSINVMKWNMTKYTQFACNGIVQTNLVTNYPCYWGHRAPINQLFYYRKLRILTVGISDNSLAICHSGMMVRMYLRCYLLLRITFNRLPEYNIPVIIYSTHLYYLNNDNAFKHYDKWIWREDTIVKKSVK